MSSRDHADTFNWTSHIHLVRCKLIAHNATWQTRAVSVITNLQPWAKKMSACWRVTLATHNSQNYPNRARWDIVEEIMSPDAPRTMPGVDDGVVDDRDSSLIKYCADNVFAWKASLYCRKLSSIIHEWNELKFTPTLAQLNLSRYFIFVAF